MNKKIVILFASILFTLSTQAQVTSKTSTISRDQKIQELQKQIDELKNTPSSTTEENIKVENTVYTNDSEDGPVASWEKNQPSGSTSDSKPKTKTTKASSTYSTSSSSDNKLRFGVGLILSGASTLSFTDIKASSGVTGTYKETFEPAFGFTGEMKMSAPHSWGFSVGLNYMMETKSKDSETTTNTGGSSSGSTNGDDKVQFISLEGNAIYKWENFYLPFGLHYGNINLKPKLLPGESLDATSGFGLQFGAGYEFNNNFTLEAIMKSTTLKITGKTSSGTTLDYGTGTYTNLNIAAKYYF